MERAEALRLLVDWLDAEMVRQVREALVGSGPEGPPPLLRVLPEVRDAAWPPPSPYLPPSDLGYPGALPLSEDDIPSSEEEVLIFDQRPKSQRSRPGFFVVSAAEVVASGIRVQDHSYEELLHIFRPVRVPPAGAG